MLNKDFLQSNSSVYVLYNDAPPSLDYIHEYGHTKGTVWDLTFLFKLLMKALCSDFCTTKINALIKNIHKGSA